MRALIKAGNEAHGFVIAPLGVPSGPASGNVAVPVSREDPLAAEARALRARLEEQRAQIAGHAAALEDARAEGEAAGRLAMERDFRESRDKALELLAAGITVAHDKLDDLVQRAELLGVLVARAAIAKLFGQDDAREAAVVDLAKHRLAQIERHMLVAIEVARADFPDTREVQELAARLGVDRVLLSVSDALAPGDCRMRCRLGTLDIGLNQQWGAIRELLDQWTSEPSVAP